jgi:hypothetical protein
VDRRQAQEQAESIQDDDAAAAGLAASSDSAATIEQPPEASPQANAVVAELVPVGQSGASTPVGREPAGAVKLAVSEPAEDDAGQVVLDYCCAVRGVLNDDQGGPLHPPGLRMANALQEVHESLQRNLDAKKGGVLRGNCAGSRAASSGDCRQ